MVWFITYITIIKPYSSDFCQKITVVSNFIYCYIYFWHLTDADAVFAKIILMKRLIDVCWDICFDEGTCSWLSVCVSAYYH